MIMKQHCCANKLCSQNKLFVIRALSVSKDSGECGIIGPGSDMREVVSEVHSEMESINPVFFGVWGQKLLQQKKNCLNKKSIHI